MDVTSYLLGKKKGGGAPVNLQTKSVTITENGTSSVQPDTGYTGLSKVNITTNVSGGGSGIDWSQIGYSTTPQYMIDDFNYAKEIYDNWDNTQTSLSNKFTNDNNLVIMPLVDTKNATIMNSMFQNCKNLKSVPLLDTKNVEKMYNMFNGCEQLVTVPELNTENVTDAMSMFNGCTKLVNVPILNLKNVKSYASNMFNNCKKLSVQSLDNILQTCIGMTTFTGTKKLSTLGITSTFENYSSITSLPHYQDFLNAGWTIS